MHSAVCSTGRLGTTEVRRPRIYAIGFRVLRISRFVAFDLDSDSDSDLAFDLIWIWIWIWIWLDLILDLDSILMLN